jgi:hypothetical protein
MLQLTKSLKARLSFGGGAMTGVHASSAMMQALPATSRNTRFISLTP